MFRRFQKFQPAYRGLILACSLPVVHCPGTADPPVECVAASERLGASPPVDRAGTPEDKEPESSRPAAHFEALSIRRSNRQRRVAQAVKLSGAIRSGRSGVDLHL